MPPVSVFAQQRFDMFEHIDIELVFNDRLIGGCPKDPKLVRGWLGKNLGITDEKQLNRRVFQHLSEMGVLPEDATEDISNEDMDAALDKAGDELKLQGFKRTPDGAPFIEGRQIKAGIKEAVNILFTGGAKWGQLKGRNAKGQETKTYQGKSPRSFTAERVFVEQDILVVGGSDDVRRDLSIGHIVGPEGPRSTIGHYEYTSQSEIALRLLQLRSQKEGGSGEGALSQDQWAQVWAHMELNGLGAMRSQGFGQFVVTKFEVVYPGSNSGPKPAKKTK